MLVLRQLLKQMPMKIETPADSEIVGENQDVILKEVMVNLHITIINPNTKILMPQIKTKARSLCRNMTMPATAVA